MSLRFILLYLSCLIATTLYFMNMPATRSAISMSNSEFILVKFINQSQAILLFAYFSIKYYGKYTQIIRLIILAQVVFMMGDVISVFIKDLSVFFKVNNLLAITYRIIFAYIFILEGAKFAKIPKDKLLILIPFYLLTFIVYYNFFNQIDSIAQFLSILSVIVYLSYLWICANRPVNPLNAWITLIAATVAIFNRFNYLIHSYVKILGFTFSLMRPLLFIAELIIIWAILSNANLMPRRLKI